ncbi:2-dehydropantoate 2-reductase (Ketopantoate reductase) (KPA reductase) (KPR) [Diaporthe australafricana]|uniref:2-dehydropantoate 2-reductase (Ketopantoate reductase) (KPA reductase) (KPR) n=1 Tax=Diaporthe australafricana TaxID=127596 RepID=A0ABR3WR97_9PEZI
MPLSKILRAQLGSRRTVARRFSQRSTGAPRERPPWLQAAFDDAASPARPFAWTLENLERNSATPKSPEKEWIHSRGDSERRIYVLGVGNLGRLYAACLAQLSNPPPITLVVHRRSLLEHWATDPGIEITRYGTPERVSNLDIEWWTTDKPSVGPVREIADGGRLGNLIITTKAQDAMPQLDSLRQYLDSSSSVLFVQNGVNRLWPPHGPAYNAHRYPGGQHPNWLHGVTMHGVYSEGPFKSVHAAPADITIGPVCSSEEHPESARYLTEMITKAPHLAARAVSKPQLWILQLEKLVINMIINPLSAILRVKNGELFADRDSDIVKVMDVLVKETSNVLQALVRHESSTEILQGDELSGEALIQRLSATRLRELLHQVGEKVKHNKSSMFQDIEAGKQTEIGEFNGWLVETAEMLDQGLDVSSHKIVIDLVEQKVKLDKHELGRHVLSASLIKDY